MKKKIINDRIIKKSILMSYQDNFTFTSDYNTVSDYNTSDCNAESSKDSDMNFSYTEPSIADISDIDISWSTVDYGGTTVNDGLF